MNFVPEEANTNKVEVCEEFLSGGAFKKFEKEEDKTIKTEKCLNIGNVNKPLLYLRIAQCVWFTSAVGLLTFISVFFKQRGLSMKELFFMYALSPVVQYLCVLPFGLLADKLGRSKPIVIFNLLSTMALAMTFILLPSMANTQRKNFIFHCGEDSNYHNISLNASCRNIEDSFLSKFCNSSHLEEQDIDCDLIYNFENRYSYWATENMSSPLGLKSSLDENCTFDDLITENKSLQVACNGTSKTPCKVKCETSTAYQSPWMYEYRTVIVVCYMITQFAFNLTYGNVFRFLDVLSMNLLKEYSSNLGHARFWSALGAVFGPLLTSFAVQSSTSSTGVANYDTIFYVYIALNAITLTVICQMKVSTLEQGKDFWKKTLTLIKNPDVLVLFLILLVTGGAWGFMVVFKAWYLDDLGAESYFIGLQGTIENLIALPFLFISKWYIKTFGYSKIFIFALLSRATASFTYSFLKTAWPALLLSVLELFSYHVFWVCVMNYCHDMTPKGFISTVLSVAGTTHFSIGRVLGSVIGGAVASAYGGRAAFRIMGYLCVGTILFYMVYLFVKNIRRKTQAHESYNEQRIIPLYQFWKTNFQMHDNTFH